MIRQTITKEDFAVLTTKEKCRLIELIYPNLKPTDALLFDRATLTIGVLQGLLLDAGYGVAMKKAMYGLYTVEISEFGECEREHITSSSTSAPINVLLEAVLTLVIDEKA